MEFERTKWLERDNGKKAGLRADWEDRGAWLERVRDAYRRVLEELALHKRRMFVQTSERRSDPEGQLAFDSLLATFRVLSAQLQQAEEDAAGGQDTTNDPAGTTQATSDEPPRGPRGPRGPKDPRSPGRRDLSESELPVVRVELRDEELEQNAEFVAFETQ